MNPTDFLRKFGEETAARKKKARTTKRRQKVLRKRAARELLPWEERDECIHREFKRLLKLSEWKQRLRMVIPTLEIRRGRSAHSSGSCETWTRRIVVTIGIESDRAAIIELLLHELAHASAGAEEHHGLKFRSILTQAVEEQCGAVVTETPHADVYQYDTQLVRAMRLLLPPSARAGYRRGLEEKRVARREQRKRRPVGRPGELAVAITPTALETIDADARSIINGPGADWRQRRRVVGRWVFAPLGLWAYAKDALEMHAGSLWTPEDGDRFASLNKSIGRIMEATR